MNPLTTQDYIHQLQDTDADEDIRRNAAWRLGRVRDITVVEPLISALHDSSAEVRVRVAEALGGQHDPRVPPALIQALQLEADLDTRVQIIHSLGQQKAAEAISLLETLIDQDTSAEIRSAAAAALGELHGFASPETMTVLVNHVVKEPDDITRYQIMQALQKIGGRAVAQSLAQVLTPRLAVDLQLQLIEQLGLLADPVASEALTPFLAADDEAVRETAQWALSRLQS
jgi:HEAT repeat protein